MFALWAPQTSVMNSGQSLKLEKSGFAFYYLSFFIFLLIFFPQKISSDSFCVADSPALSDFIEVSPGFFNFNDISLLKCRMQCGQLNYIYGAVKDNRYCFCASAHQISIAGSPSSHFHPGDVHNDSDRFCSVVDIGYGTYRVGTAFLKRTELTLSLLNETDILIPDGSNAFPLIFSVQLKAAADLLEPAVISMDFGDGKQANYDAFNLTGSAGGTLLISHNYLPPGGTHFPSVEFRYLVDDFVPVVASLNSVIKVRTSPSIIKSASLPPQTAMNHDSLFELEALSCRDSTTDSRLSTPICHLNVVPSADATTLHVNYGDGSETEVIQIPEPVVNKIGSVIRPENEPLMFNMNSGLHVNKDLMLFEPVSQAGVLHVVEFFATRPGNITLKIFRPVCRSPFQYCYASDSCVPLSTNCGRQCCPRFFFKDGRYQCRGENTTEQTESNTTVTLSLLYKYNLNNVAGYNFIDFMSTNGVPPLTVLPGDRFGYKTHLTRTVESPVILQLPTDIFPDLYESNNRLIRTPIRSQAAVTVTNVYPVDLYHAYSISGAHFVHINATSLKVGPNETAQALDQWQGVVHVTGSLSKCTLTMTTADHSANLPYVASDISVKFKLNIVSGATPDLEYLWDFPHIGEVEVKDYKQTTQSMSYIDPGTYDINATVKSNTAQTSCKTVLHVQERLSNLILHQLSNETTVAVGAKLNYVIKLGLGSHIICSLEYNDPSKTIIPVNGSHPFSTARYMSGFVIGVHFSSPNPETIVTLHCKNNISALNASAEPVRVVVPIGSLVLDHTVAVGGKVGHPFVVPFLLDAGSDIELVSVIFEGENINDSVTFNNTGLAGTIGPLPPVNQSSILTYLFTFSNALETVERVLNFTIETPFEFGGYTVSGETVDIKAKGNSLNVSVWITEGSSIHIRWQWGDGSPDDTYYSGAQQPWRPINGTQTRSHTYRKGGTFPVKLIADNGATHHHFDVATVTVIYPPDDQLLFLTSAPHIHTEETDFWFQVANTSGNSRFEYADGEPGGCPNHATVKFHFGVGDQSYWHERGDFRCGRRYAFNYTSGGIFKVRAVVTNQLGSWEYVIEKVQINALIEDLRLKVVPPHAPVDFPVKASVTMFSGNPVDLSWRWGDSSPKYELPQPIVGSFGHWHHQTHTYNSVGKRTITITALCKPLGQQDVSTHVIHIQHPVYGVYGVRSSSPTYKTSQKALALTLTKINMSLSNATDFKFSVIFPSASGLPISTRGSYLELSKYTITCSTPLSRSFVGAALISVENLVSKEGFLVETNVYDQITSIKLVNLTYRPELPLSGPYLPAYDGFNGFLIQYPVYFNVDVTGTVEKYQLEVRRLNDSIKIDDVVLSRWPPQPSYKFQNSGNFSVKVTAENPWSTQQTSLEVHILDQIRGLTINDDNIVPKPDTNKNLSVVFNSLGTVPCVAIDFGDNAAEIWSEFYGDSSTCRSAFWKSDLLKTSPPAPSKTVFSLTSSILHLSHVYKQVGQHQLRVVAFDIAGGWEILEHSVLVSDANCIKPVLSITDRRPQFQQPLLLKRNQRSVIEARLENITCSRTLQNNKQWRIYAVDLSTGQDTSEVNIAQLPTAVKTTLSIPVRFLSYGIYRLEFTVEMDPTYFLPNERFYGSIDTFIRVLPGSIRPALQPGVLAALQVQYGKTAVLSPETYSKDPDEDPNGPQGFTDFIWFCRVLSGQPEQYPKLPNGSFDTSFRSVPRVRDFTVDVDNGGCFGDGPGAINISNGTWPLDSSMLKFNETYEIMVRIVKQQHSFDGEITTRSAISRLELSLTPGEPPALLLNCHPVSLCIAGGSSGFRINPGIRLALMGRCLSGCSIGRGEETVSWQMFFRLPGDVLRPVSNFSVYHMGGDIGFQALVDSRLFTDYVQFNDYRLRFTVERPGYFPGFSHMDIEVNRPPHGGNCSVSPTEGVLYSTTYNVSCFDWVDFDGVAEYRFYVENSDGSIIRQVAYNNYGELTNYPLPLGPENSDSTSTTTPSTNTPALTQYSWRLMVRVIDSAKSFVNHHIGDVNVIPPPPAAQQTVIGSLLDEIASEDQNSDVSTSQGGALAEIIAKGDLQGSNAVFLQLATGLNEMASSVEKVYGNLVTDNAAASSEGNVQSSKTDAAKQSLVNKHETERDNRAKELYLFQLRALMLEGLTSLPVTASESAAQLTATTAAALLVSPDEVSRSGQKAVGTLASTLASSLLDNEGEDGNDLPIETVTAVAPSIVDMVGQGLTAATQGLEKPLKSDLAEAAKTAFYDSDLDSKQAWIEPNNPDGGKIITLYENTRIQSAVVSSMSDAAISALDNCAKLTLKKMIPGEKPVDYNLPNMQLALISGYADNMTGGNSSEDEKTSLQTQGGGEVKFPDVCSMLYGNSDECNSSSVVNMQLTASPGNMFKGAKGASKLAADGGTVGFSLLSAPASDGSATPGIPEPIAVKNASTPIEIWIPRASQSPPDPIVYASNPLGLAPGFVPKINIHTSPLTITDTAASLHVQMKPFIGDKSAPNASTSSLLPRYLLVIKFNSSADLSARDWDFITMLPANLDSNTTGLDTTTNVPTTAAVTGADVKRDKPDRKGAIASPTYHYFLDNHQLAGRTGKLYFGIRQLDVNETEANAQYSDADPPPSDRNFTGLYENNFTLTVFTSGCYYYSPSVDSWNSDGCKVGPATTWNRTQCLCTHLTSFGGAMTIAPNTIDWEFVFANFDIGKNPTLFATQIIILICYAFLAIWARHKDKSDVRKLGVAALTDNNPRYTYLYELVVHTGSRKNAGTTSNVMFVLSGEKTDTGVHCLSTEGRSVLKKGRLDAFLMVTKGPLGGLQHLRVWHDNSGKGDSASWFFSHMVVRDLQTGKRFLFVCNRWLAVEKDDGMIDRLVPVAGKEDATEFSHLMTGHTGQAISDDHVWFSVFANQSRSRFTRLQRVSCCLCLLYLTMLANALFYGRDTNSGSQFSIGPFALSIQQVYVGFISNLIVLPVSLVIITLFRKSRRRRWRRTAPLQKVVDQHGEKHRAALASSIPQVSRQPTSYTAVSVRHVEPDLVSSTHNNFANMGVTVTAVEEIQRGGVSPPANQSASRAEVTGPAHLTTDIERCADQAGEAEKKRHKRRLKGIPWWCAWIAWALLVITVLICASFVTFYGIMFGDAKCKKWISSMLISFVSAVFFTQPIKIIIFAALLSMICKKTVDDDQDALNEDDEFDLCLEIDEQWLHPPPSGGWLSDDSDSDDEDMMHVRKRQPPPVDVELLARLRIAREKEMKMNAVLREITFYCLFILVVGVLSSETRDRNTIFVQRELSALFVHPGDPNGLSAASVYDDVTNVQRIRGRDFRRLSTTEDLWKWFRHVLIPGLRAKVWYNRAQPFGQRGFLADRASRMMGYATLRQVRSTDDTCSVQRVADIINIMECIAPFNEMHAERRDFGRGWNLNHSGDSPPEYRYRTPSELDSFPVTGTVGDTYEGGGYLVKLTGNVRVLHETIDRLWTEKWIDRKTRAVFVDFTVYNPNVNLFAVCTFIAQMPTTGGVFTKNRIEPIRLLFYIGDTTLMRIIFEALFVFFMIVYLCRETTKIKRERCTYFKSSLWNIVELLIILFGWTAIAIYIYQLVLVSRITARFRETRGFGYMKFQYVAGWKETLDCVMAFLCFLSILKLLKLLRFNRRIGLLSATLSKAGSDLLSFSMTFAVSFTSFVSFFHLLLVRFVQSYSTWLRAFMSLFQVILGKFHFNELVMAGGLLARIFFFFYSMTALTMLLPVLITIIDIAFKEVMDDISHQPNEHEIMEYMWKKCRSALIPAGSSGPQPNIGEQKETKRKRSNTESLESKIDRLSTAIDRHYVDINPLDELDDIFGANDSEVSIMLNDILVDENLQDDFFNEKERPPPTGMHLEQIDRHLRVMMSSSQNKNHY